MGVEVLDNIAESTAQPSSLGSGSTNTEPVNSEQNIFTLMQACEMIAKYYDRGFKQLKFAPPMQITDGCVAEFVDSGVNAVVASVRMRFRNRVHINKESGAMHAEILLSDLSFSRPSLTLDVDTPKGK